MTAIIFCIAVPLYGYLAFWLGRDIQRDKERQEREWSAEISRHRNSHKQWR